MRVILAESGKEFELSSIKDNELRNIKQKIESKIKIKYSDQILIAANGTQLKDSDTDIHDTIVVFNRRLLQDPASVQQLIQSSIMKESNIQLPNLKELETMLYKDQLLMDTINHIVCVNRNSSIDQLTNEINAQTIALNAALNNLESHVRVAYQNFSKFDRIAQREFTKHSKSISNINLDIELLYQINIHPRIINNNKTLSQLVPIKELEKSKHMILQKYDQLVNSTLEQKNKVNYLYHQTSNLNTQRTALETTTQRIYKLNTNVNYSTTSILDIQKKIINYFKRLKKKDTLYLQLNTPPSSQQDDQRKKLLDLNSIYLHQSIIKNAEISMGEEKKNSVTMFVQSMQSISQVEESVTKIYPKLADLEKEIKLLRQDIENSTTARRLIIGYGVLLIELWRRDKYTEIVKGNANLLQTLFNDFGQLEKSYRSNFEQEVTFLDKQKIKTQPILPLQFSNMSELPIICTTSITNESTEDNIITKSQIQDYIQMVHLFYYAGSNNDRKSRSNTTEQTSHDISSLLSQQFERETKRIRIGLFKLGLPNGSSETNQNKNAKEFSPSFSSSSTTTSYFTPDMKLASPATNHMNTTIFYQQKDWDKPSMLRQSSDYREYIDNLNIKHEKDKQSLLRKLQLQEQRIKEMEGNYNNQFQEFQNEIQNAEKYLKIKEQEWKAQNEINLKVEQEKYDRRVNGFHQRMQAKDQEFAKLEESVFRETKSAPSSPTSSSFPSSRRRHAPFRNQASPPVVSQEQYDQDIDLLNQKIEQLKSNHQQEIKSIKSEHSDELNQIKSDLQNQHTAQLKQVADALQSEHRCQNEELLTLINSLESEKNSYADKLSQFDKLKEQMDVDRSREFELNQTIIKELRNEIESIKQSQKEKTAQMNEKFQKNQSRMKSLFMNENHQISIQCEARIENLISDHKNTVQELKDNLEIEKDVVSIKHQHDLDELNRSFINEKQILDQNLNLLNQQYQKLNLDYSNFKKETFIKTKQLKSLQQELKTAKRMANDVFSVSVDSYERIDPNISLIDLLTRTLSNVSSLKTKSSIMESMDSPYMMNITSYGY